MRTSQIKCGTLWMFEHVGFPNHSKTHYRPKYKGHISRRPDWWLKLRANAWEWFGI